MSTNPAAREPRTIPATLSPLRRLSAERTHWRVGVESWPDGDGFHGRFVFEADTSQQGRPEVRQGPVALSGASAEDVVRSAYEVSDDRLRALLHSLS